MRTLTVSAMALAGAVVAAQYAPVTPAFEVDVIKRNTSGDGSTAVGTRPGGAYVMVNGPMRSVFGNAYPSQASGIINMPDWFGSERYDLTARIVGNPTPEQRQELWRMLFTERMKLKVHYETREQPTYDLVLARSDGRLGPNLKPAAVDCAARAAAVSRGESPPPLPAPLPGAAPACGMIASSGMIRMGGQTMASFARSLGAGRLVIDKTGLSGSYDLTLEYARQALPSADGPQDDRPSLFAALQEQLGLKLEPSRSPVQFAVIDYVERPIVD